jgi:hypothetical protein
MSYSLLIFAFGLLITHSGISKEVRSASGNLVLKQKISRKTPKIFHFTKVNKRSMYLNSKYIKSKTNLELTSANLLKHEKYQLSAIKNKYLLQKRPEAKCLEMMGLDLNKYAEDVEGANIAIGKA